MAGFLVRVSLAFVRFALAPGRTIGLVPNGNLSKGLVRAVPTSAAIALDKTRGGQPLQVLIDVAPADPEL